MPISRISTLFLIGKRCRHSSTSALYHYNQVDPTIQPLHSAPELTAI
jgi:hypothetical protein